MSGMTDTSDLLRPARDARARPPRRSPSARSARSSGATPSRRCAPTSGWSSSDFAALRRRASASSPHRVRELEERLRKPALPPSDQELITALGRGDRPRARPGARVGDRAAGQGRGARPAGGARGAGDRTRAARPPRSRRSRRRPARPRTPRAPGPRRSSARRARCASACSPTSTSVAQELERQIAELRAGRGKLVETYELVERALAHATRVMAEEPSAPPDVPAVDERRAPTTRRAGADDRRRPTRPRPTPAPTPRRSRTVEPTPATGDAPVDDAADRRRRRRRADAPDVGALFEKLRSGASRRRADDRPSADARGRADAPAAPEPPTPERRRRRRRDRRARASADEPTSTPTEAATRRARRRPRRRPPTTSSRRGKRALQDEQNDLLDGLRRQRGKIDTAKVLPAARGPARPLGPRAPAGGRRRLRGRRRPRSAPRPAARRRRAPARCSPSSPTAVVTPLRERLDELARVDRRPHARPTPRSRSPSASAPGTGSGGASSSRPCSATRSRRAYSRGVYDAAPDGARLRWVPGGRREVPRLRRQRARADGEGRATSRPGSRTRRRTRAVAACSSSRPPERRRRRALRSPDHRSL